MTKPITYIYRFEHEGVAHEIRISRRHTGTAYARNGNTHNPTQYYSWSAEVDGVHVIGNVDQRAVAYEYARASILGIRYVAYSPYRPGKERNVRSYLLVADEMKSNYVRRQTV